MKEKELRKARTILNELITHPISFGFKTPMFVDPKEKERFKRCIKTPMDLSLLRKNLNGGKYKNFDAFIHDMGLIYKNAETFCGRDSYITILAKELDTLFNKICKRSGVLPLSEWCQIIIRKKAKINKFLLFPEFPGAPIKKNSEENMVSSQLMKVEDFDKIIAMADLIPDIKFHTQLITEIEKRQPELMASGETLTIDLTQMNYTTSMFVKEELEKELVKLGIEIPQ